MAVNIILGYVGSFIKVKLQLSYWVQEPIFLQDTKTVLLFKCCYKKATWLMYQISLKYIIICSVMALDKEVPGSIPAWANLGDDLFEIDSGLGVQRLPPE